MRFLTQDPVLPVRAARAAMSYMMSSPAVRAIYDEAVKNGWRAEFSSQGLTVFDPESRRMDFYDKKGQIIFSKESHRIAEGKPISTLIWS